jgi:HB1, ASXL, restriction endonuclease HTH domain
MSKPMPGRNQNTNPPEGDPDPVDSVDSDPVDCPDPEFQEETFSDERAQPPVVSQVPKPAPRLAESPPVLKPAPAPELSPIPEPKPVELVLAENAAPVVVPPDPVAAVKPVLVAPAVPTQATTITYKELALRVLSLKAPLSATEIWEEGKALGLTQLVKATGKTPAASLGSKLYIDIRDNPNTRFERGDGKFWLKQSA